MITTTLNRIRAHHPCKLGWLTLLAGLGKTKADDEPIPFTRIVEINGLDDALWCCRVEPQNSQEWQLFTVWCTQRVQHLIKETDAWAAGRAAAGAAAGVAPKNAAEGDTWDDAWDVERNAQTEYFLKIVS